MGRIATILFAHKLGTSLEAECKMYRLAADIFNDTAMVLDCLSPAFPKTPRIILLSLSSVLRALCGVAAGSSKASLSAHFAKWGNIGELNAAGSIVVSHVSRPFETWSCLLLLLSIHLAMNHAAVRSVSLRTLNRQRANVVFSNYLHDKKVLSPEDVSQQERIFEYDGCLRWKGQRVIGRARVGVSLQELLKPLVEAHAVTGALRNKNGIFPQLIALYTEERYLLWYDGPNQVALVVFKSRPSPQDQLKAWAHALFAAHRLRYARHATSASPSEVLGILRDVQMELSSMWVACMQQINDAGWDIDTANIETTARMRIEG
ncbi:MAG: hypothetical protein Q9163_004225 [Psora crenata]